MKAHVQMHETVQIVGNGCIGLVPLIQYGRSTGGITNCHRTPVDLTDNVLDTGYAYTEQSYRSFM